MVNQPDAYRVLHGEGQDIGEEVTAFIHGGEIAQVQFFRHGIELFRGRVCLPQWEGQPAVCIEEVEVASLIAADGGCYPTTGVDVELALVGVSSDPDSRGLGGGLVIADDAEAEVFKHGGNVVADLLALILGADEEDYLDGLILVVPDAVDKHCAQRFHFLVNDLGRFVGVVRVLELELAHGVDESGVVGEGVGDGQVARGGEAAVDFLGDEIAVDEVVHGLADAGHGERVEFASAVEDRSDGVKGQLCVYAEGVGVGEAIHPLDGGVDLVIADGEGVGVDFRQIHAGHGRGSGGLFDGDDFIDPGAGTFAHGGGRFFFRRGRCCGRLLFFSGRRLLRCGLFLLRGGRFLGHLGLTGGTAGSQDQRGDQQDRQEGKSFCTHTLISFSKCLQKSIPQSVCSGVEGTDQIRCAHRTVYRKFFIIGSSASRRPSPMR